MIFNSILFVPAPATALPYLLPATLPALRCCAVAFAVCYPAGTSHRFFRSFRIYCPIGGKAVIFIMLICKSVFNFLILKAFWNF